MKLKSVCWIVVLIVIASCNVKNDLYEKLSSFPKHEWSSSEKKTYTFKIQDTTAQYRVYFVFRHFDAYRYKNIWLDIQLKAPDRTYQVKREFTLADNEKWRGNTIDDIVEQRVPFDAEATKLRAGTYSVTLQHIMREEPLQGVLNAGIRVEKINP